MVRISLDVECEECHADLEADVEMGVLVCSGCGKMYTIIVNIKPIQEVIA